MICILAHRAAAALIRTDTKAWEAPEAVFNELFIKNTFSHDLVSGNQLQGDLERWFDTSTVTSWGWIINRLSDNNNSERMSHTHKYSSKAVIKMFVMSGPSSVSSLPTSLISLMDATHKDGRVGQFLREYRSLRTKESLCAGKNESYVWRDLLGWTSRLAVDQLWPQLPSECPASLRSGYIHVQSPTELNAAVVHLIWNYDFLHKYKDFILETTLWLLINRTKWLLGTIFSCRLFGTVSAGWSEMSSVRLYIDRTAW